MVLKRLIVKNFQKHKSKTIDLDPYITIFSGPSSVGKSSLIRALKWISLNHQPVNFARRGQDDCEGILEFDEYTVKRRKNKKVNEYYLNESIYKAFGARKVPEDIEKILNIGHINFTHQLDGPFWFDISPGEVSKKLNEIIKLDVIDTSLSKASSSVKETKIAVKLSEERLKKTKEQKKSLTWVVDLNDDLVFLEEKHKELDGVQNKITKCFDYLLSLNNCQTKHQNYSKSLEEWEVLLSKYPYKTVEKTDKLEKFSLKLKELEERLVLAKEEEEKIEKQLNDNKGIVCPTCGQEVGKECLE